MNVQEILTKLVIETNEDSRYSKTGLPDHESLHKDVVQSSVGGQLAKPRLPKNRNSSYT